MPLVPLSVVSTIENILFLLHHASSNGIFKYFSAQRVPFVVQFRTDQNEVLSDEPAVASAGSNEIAEWPAGIVGFKLDFVQNSC